MRFHDLTEELLNGAKLRREAWYEGEYIRRKEMFNIVGETGERRDITDEVMHDDWVVYVPYENFKIKRLGATTIEVQHACGQVFTYTLVADSPFGRRDRVVVLKDGEWHVADAPPSACMALTFDEALALCKERNNT